MSYFLNFRSFSRYNNIIIHGVSTRIEGVSKEEYRSLNLSYKVGDLKEHVKINRTIWARNFNFPLSAIFEVNQIHSKKVIWAKDFCFKNSKADGIITSENAAVNDHLGSIVIIGTFNIFSATFFGKCAKGSDAMFSSASASSLRKISAVEVIPG